jgi:hypothetical protein
MIVICCFKAVASAALKSPPHVVVAVAAPARTSRGGKKPGTRTSSENMEGFVPVIERKYTFVVLR